MGRKTKTRKRIVPLSGLKNILENYYVLQRFSGHAYKYVPTKLISVQRIIHAETIHLIWVWGDWGWWRNCVSVSRGDWGNIIKIGDIKLRKEQFPFPD